MAGFELIIYTKPSLSIGLKVREVGHCLDKLDSWLFTLIKMLSSECGKVIYKDNISRVLG